MSTLVRYGTVHTLDTRWGRARGVIGRYPGPDEAYVFEFDGVEPRAVHMVGVRHPLRVRWYDGDELVADEVLRPRLGQETHPADRVIETRPNGSR